MAKKKNKKKQSFTLARSKSYSSIYEQVVRISPLVAKILAKNIKARDDDNVLLFAVWKKKGLKEKWSVKKFKYKFIMGRLGLPETIMRSRRLLQSKHQSLRGKMYAQRHEAEQLMSTQMKLFL